MTIKVWTDFSKRKNSTKQPTGGTQVDVRLKDNCSIENPVFLLSSPVTDYTYVEAFGHYYFVTDVVNVNAGMSEVHCKQDVLATYKTAIGNTTAFILYDTSSNTTLQDTRLPSKHSPSISKTSNPLHSALSLDGSLIATVTGQDATYCYVISTTDIYKLVPDIKTQVQNVFAGDHTPSGILDDDFVPTIISAVRQIISSGSLAENIRDVRWVPFTVSGTGVFQVYVGMYNTTIYAGRIGMTGTNRISSRQFNLSIPWQFSDWRNSFNTEIMVHIPFVGDVSFPAADLVGNSTIGVVCSLDLISGDIAVELKGGSTGNIIGSYGASTGITIPLGNASPSLAKMATALIQGTAPAGSMIGNINNAVRTAGNFALTAFTPMTQTVGGLGSAAGIGTTLDVVITTICHDTIVSPSSVSSVIGTPAYASKQISTLTGYVQCQDASVEANCKDSDRDEINEYLNSGFFYE